MNLSPAASSFLGSMPENYRELIFSVSKKVRYSDGQLIHSRGDQKHSMCVILSGSVRFSNVGLDGKHVTLGTLTAGDTFGGFTVFTDAPRMFDMHARGETVLNVIERERLDELLLTEPGLSKYIIQMLAQRLLLVLEILDDERRLPLAVRLAKTLLRTPVAGADDAGIAATQKELAAELAVSRVSMAAALKKLREQGLVETSYGRIRIPSRGQLRRWVDEQSQLVIVETD